jgi:hypothetical protein
MGAERSQGGRKNYFTAIDGKMTQRISEEDYNAEKVNDPSSVRLRKKEDGTPVYERIFDGISGYLKGYSEKDTPFGTIDANFVLEDNGEEYHVQFRKGSRPHKMVLMRFPNIDPSRKIYIGVFNGDNADKTQKVMMSFVKYDGEQGTIGSAFPRDGDHNLPDLEKIKVKGKEQWDDTKQLEYFDSVTIPEMLKRIEGSGVNVETKKPQPQPESVVAGQDDDDLFF